MKKTFYIDKNKLHHLFINENRSRKWIAEYFGCSDALIKQKCVEYNIKKPKKLESENKKRRVVKECLHCKKDFQVVPSRAEGRWEIKFCSHKCSSDHRYLGQLHKRRMLNAVAATRRANKKKASVGLNEEDKSRIMKMYLECPEGYEVDHIIPLSKGGKHHPDNLQYLTVSENRKKSNKCINM